MPLPIKPRLLVRLMIVVTLIVRATAAVGQSVPDGDRGSSEVTVVVADLTGARLPNAEIKFLGGVEATTETGMDGSAKVTLPQGKYLVIITCPGFELARVRDFSVDPTQSATLNVALQFGPNTQDWPGDPGVPVHVPTITSDLPNIIPNVSIASLPTGGGPLQLHLLPQLHSEVFAACPAEQRCSRTSTFHVKSVPPACCFLVAYPVSDAGGRSTDDLSGYQVFLNGKEVSTSNGVRTRVMLRRSNALKVVLPRRSNTRICVLIFYDPSEPNG